jgi:hypothetical protein
MATSEDHTSAQEFGVPSPPSEARAWLAACAIALCGLGVMIAVLTGVVGRSPSRPLPAVLVRASTPQPSSAAAQSALAPVRAAEATDSSGAGVSRAIVDRPSTVQQRRDAHHFKGATAVHIPQRWMEGFYPIYATAQRTFGVSWLLLASIHMQESAFSTAPGIYQGLNFAHCCGGPMQFNVTNGGRNSSSTWDLVSGSYLHGKRPASYDHMTARHPSIYDDFDALMAAAHLLSADGAGYALDGAAWAAAYDYYGHDATGILYADQVLARAIGWSQHGFCINCGVDQGMVQAVHAAYGAAVQSALEAAEEPTAGAARVKRGG